MLHWENAKQIKTQSTYLKELLHSRKRNVVVVNLYTLPANRYVHAASKKLQIRTATWCLLYGILEPSGMRLVQDN